MFARLKKWLVLSGGNIESFELKEIELDIAMALQNLLERERLGLMQSIPPKPKLAPGSHIITRDLEPQLKIPKAVNIADKSFPSHLHRFHGALTSIAPSLNRNIQPNNVDNSFGPRLVKRGENLFNGGNVLQIRVPPEDNDVWRVKFKVAASMKATVYETWIELQKGVGVVQQICMCKAG